MSAARHGVDGECLKRQCRQRLRRSRDRQVGEARHGDRHLCRCRCPSGERAQRCRPRPERIEGAASQQFQCSPGDVKCVEGGHTAVELLDQRRQFGRLGADAQSWAFDIEAALETGRAAPSHAGVDRFGEKCRRRGETESSKESPSLAVAVWSGAISTVTPEPSPGCAGKAIRINSLFTDSPSSLAPTCTGVGASSTARCNR